MTEDFFEILSNLKENGPIKPLISDRHMSKQVDRSVELTLEQKKAVLDYVTGYSTKAILEDVRELDVGDDDWTSIGCAVENFLDDIFNKMKQEVSRVVPVSTMRTRVFLRSDSSDEPAIYCGNASDISDVLTSLQHLMAHELDNLIEQKEEKGIVTTNLSLELIDMTDAEVANLS